MTHDHEHTSCQSLLGSLSAYVDGELSDELCQAIRAHMEGCEHCRVVVDTLTKTVYLYHGVGREVDVPNDVQSRLFNVLKLDDLLPTDPA
jgi:anti-sigma factor (TIGR02949 family)